MRRLTPVITLALLTGLAGSARAATGRSCDHPLQWHLTHQETRQAVGSGISHHPAGGPKIQIFAGHPSYSMRAVIEDPAWRLCAVSTASPSGRVPAPIEHTRSGSEVSRQFTSVPSTMAIAYARRNRAKDGASCANPFVVNADEFGSTGDRAAGMLRWSLENAIRGETAHETASWAPKAGYHTCLVGGLAMTGRPFTDHRSSGKHVLASYSCCPNTTSGSNVAYLFAAFAKD